jgi:hypothetical protein
MLVKRFWNINILDENFEIDFFDLKSNYLYPFLRALIIHSRIFEGKEGKVSINFEINLYR